VKFVRDELRFILGFHELDAANRAIIKSSGGDVSNPMSPRKTPSRRQKNWFLGVAASGYPPSAASTGNLPGTPPVGRREAAPLLPAVRCVTTVSACLARAGNENKQRASDAAENHAKVEMYVPQRDLVNCLLTSRFVPLG
jgi:hypothetical protein